MLENPKDQKCWIVQLRWRPKYFPDYQPDQIDGPGDGTVNLRSLQLCKKFKRLKGYKVYPGIKQGEHMQILLNPDVINYVRSIVMETTYYPLDNSEIVF